MQLSLALIFLIAMDMEVVMMKMVSVIVIETGLVILTVQVMYQVPLWNSTWVIYFGLTLFKLALSLPEERSF